MVSEKRKPCADFVVATTKSSNNLNNSITVMLTVRSVMVRCLWGAGNLCGDENSCIHGVASFLFKSTCDLFLGDRFFRYADIFR